VCSADSSAVGRAPADQLDPAGLRLLGLDLEPRARCEAERAHPAGPARPRVVDRLVGADLEGQRELAPAAGRRDHPRAGIARQLHQQRADAARSGFDEDRLAGGDPRPADQPERRAPVREQCARGVERQAFGDLDQPAAGTAARSA